jgi:hypothetical protein
LLVYTDQFFAIHPLTVFFIIGSPVACTKTGAPRAIVENAAQVCRP